MVHGSRVASLPPDSVLVQGLLTLIILIQAYPDKNVVTMVFRDLNQRSLNTDQVTPLLLSLSKPVKGRSPSYCQLWPDL